MKSVFEKMPIWDKLQAALVKYITIGLDYPVTNPINKMGCKPQLTNPNFALVWTGTDEGQEWWMDIYHYWSDHYKFPATDEEEEVIEDDED